MSTVLQTPAVGSGVRKEFDLPVDREFLFSDHNGKVRKGIEKRQTRLMGKLAFLKPFLKEGEKIRLVTTGCSPMTFLEQMVTGWIVFYLKRSLIVFTDRRLFHIPAKSDFSFRNSIAQVSYEDCEDISLKRSYVEIRYKGGTREKFFYIDRRERRKLKALFSGIRFDRGTASTGGRTHLCPRCTTALVKDQYRCPDCRLVFKNLSDGRRISILYPGGGYFYTGHPFLGVGDALTELALIVLFAVALIDLLGGNSAGIVPLAIWGTGLILEKSISVYHANHFIREFIPADKTVQTQANLR